MRLVIDQPGEGAGGVFAGGVVAGGVAGGVVAGGVVGGVLAGAFGLGAGGVVFFSSHPTAVRPRPAIAARMSPLLR
jgi:hypothetical protein